ncbi:peptide ABC transporter substrate-binding protein [Mechercharimyces sp. CAU 1602]|uniref:peptide ABC transporter substrate-binding protein n=1 Tax=Mechercharimyces sp. CAU 1602 TaxID=2973933 RepID=UPI002163C417|nr:peptide ABC transporter substrate-binding protein [Mechercharimyces sp. CAU 1602]MCS1351774.1 peptide ABC transporter substrate-binding protein [Mechercharimyces sp. CAU 1602]
MQKWVRSTLVAVISSAVVLSGCSGLDVESDSAKKVEGEQKLTLTTTQDIVTLDVSKAIDTSTFNALDNTMEGLMRINQDGKPVKAIAESVEISEDKKKYTFHLRDAKWHDGEEITAQDFEYSWERTLDPKTGGEYSYIFDSILNAKEYRTEEANKEDVGIVSIDDKTLQVQLNEPIPYFLDLMAFPSFYPQRKEFVEKYGEEYGQSAESVAYNGPFVLSEWNKNEFYRMKKNDTYWDRNVVSIEEARVNVLKKTSDGVKQYMSDKADVAQLSQSFTSAFNQTKEYITVTKATTSYLNFNTKNKYLQNQNVRKALSAAIDREAWSEKVLKDGSEPAGGLIPPTIFISGQPFRDYPIQIFEPVEAKSSLKEGLRELNTSEKPTFTLLVSDDDTTRKKAVFLREQWEKYLGITVNVKAVPSKVRYKLEGEGAFDVSLMGWIGDYNDPMTFLELFQMDNELNYGKWMNERYHNLVEESKSTTDYEKRANDLREAERILLEEAAIATLDYGKEAYVEKSYVKDIARYAFGSDFSLKWAYIDRSEDE